MPFFIFLCMLMTKTYLDNLTYQIIGSAIEVHKQLGPGLLESSYSRCFSHELSLRSIKHTDQLVVPLSYKGLVLDSEYRLDIIAEDLIIIELKAVEGILKVHEAQILTYMKLLEKPKGILLNFNCTNIFKEGQRTFVNDYYSKLPR